LWWSFKQIICFKKCMPVFVMCIILATTLDPFFSAVEQLRFWLMGQW
jgi:hypothetical protein